MLVSTREVLRFSGDIIVASFFRAHVSICDASIRLILIQEGLQEYYDESTGMYFIGLHAIGRRYVRFVA